MTKSTHWKCIHPFCNTHIRVGNFCCGRHWRELSADLRFRITIAWIQLQYGMEEAWNDWVKYKGDAVVYWKELVDNRHKDFSDRRVYDEPLLKKEENDPTPS